MDTLLRNLSERDMLRLDEQAKGRRMSRNKYMTMQLSLIAKSPEIFSREDKYEKLLNLLMAELKEGRSIIRKNAEVMEAVLKKL